MPPPDTDDGVLGVLTGEQLGYDVMNNEMVDLAIDILKLNTVAHPEAYNTWDSLGEAYMINGDRERAIANYEKSLELNPENAGAADMLESLRGGGH